MRRLAHCVLTTRSVMLCVCGWLVAGSASAQSIVPAVEGPPAPAVAEPVPSDFGIVIRLSERLFQSPEPEVARRTSVRETVVGVCNVGTADTTGDLLVDFHPKQDGIAADLVFRGTSVSHTVARQRSARVTTITTTRVTATTPITFDLATGFASKPPSSHASIVGVRRNVGAEVPGLRGLIVRRVARKRIQRQEHQIRHQSEEATRQRIAADTQREVERKVSAWNEQWKPLHALLKSQPWYAKDRDIFYSSDEQHIVLYIQADATSSGNDAGPKATVDFPPKQLPDPVSGGLVDVIFYADKTQKTPVAGLLELVEAVIGKYTADLSLGERLSFDTSEGLNWVMLSISEAAELNEQAEEARRPDGSVHLLEGALE